MRIRGGRAATGVRAAVAGALFVLVVSASGADAAVPAGNLIQNPGGEAGAALAAPPSWSVTGRFSARAYGSAGASFSASIGGGANFLGGGQDDPVSTASQVFDVSGAAAEVDAAVVTAELRGYLGGNLADQDTMRVVAEVQGADPAAPFAPFLAIGPVTAAERNNQTVLLAKVASGRVPARTRRIRVTATATRSEATYDPSLGGNYTSNDGWADNLSLALTSTPAQGGGGKGGATAPSKVRRKGSVKGIKSPGRRVKGRVSVAAPCKSGRRVVVTKGRKTLGRTKSKSSGSFNIKTKKHKKSKLTVKVRKRTVGNTNCTAITKKVPGRN